MGQKKVTDEREQVWSGLSIWFKLNEKFGQKVYEVYFKASWFILDRTLSISNVVELKGMTRNGWHSDKEVMLGIKCEMDFETGWFGTERSAW